MFVINIIAKTYTLFVLYIFILIYKYMLIKCKYICKHVGTFQ